MLMKFLKDDILLSRFLQFSLLGTIVLMLVLLLSEQPVFTSAYDPLAEEQMPELVVDQPLDSLSEKTAQQFWINRPLEWLQDQITLPLSDW